MVISRRWELAYFDLRSNTVKHRLDFSSILNNFNCLALDAELFNFYFGDKKGNIQVRVE